MPTPRKLALNDLWTFNMLGSITLSPDGRRVAFVLQSTEKAKNEQHSAIWLLHLDEQGLAVGAPRQLTRGVKHDTQPAWAPDSRHLLFISDREGEKSQLWLINTEGGEARKLTTMLNGVSEAAWSPDGGWIAFTAPVSPTDDDEVLTGCKPLEETEKKKRDEEARIRLRAVSTIWYRLDGRGLFEHFTQLFVMPAPAGGEIDPATIVRLTSGAFDHDLPRWTPDSREIGVLCNRADDRDQSFIKDLWAIGRKTGEARRISTGTLQIEAYSWSPDGGQVILVAQQDERLDGGENIHLYLVSSLGGRIEDVTPQIDNSTAVAAFAGFGQPGPYLPQWSADGTHVYHLVTEHGCVQVSRLDVARKTSTAITGGEQLTHFLALLPGEQGVLLAQARPTSLWDLYLLPLTASGADEPVRLTHLNERELAEFAWSEPERLRYQGANDDEIEAWIIRPVGAREGVRYPLVVRIHGGPQSAYGVGMNPYHQYLAAQGFAVFYCNPHGSTGHGRTFLREVEGDWGGWDAQDILAGVDACIARGIADPERLVVSGYSYGGYMSMLLIGQTTRFRAAVPMAGISNLVSFVGTSDVGFWQALQAKGYPWDAERAAYYRERSPLTYATRVTTPTRFIHPENDLRCPIEQSEQFYMALKMMGNVPVELVRAPGSWHGGTSKPSQNLAYWEQMVEWFLRYVEMRAGEYQE